MNLTGELHYHLEGKEYASVRFSEGVNSVSIDIVFVPSQFRQRGIGKALVKRVLAIADAAGKEVFVTVRPLGRSGEDIISSLIRFYQQFGFVLTDRDPGLAHMHRDAMPPQAFAEIESAGGKVE
ncbi:MAG TPA: GNAT family N-acetyltransferase [Gallionellaceae bacterium]